MDEQNATNQKMDDQTKSLLALGLLASLAVLFQLRFQQHQFVFGEPDPTRAGYGLSYASVAVLFFYAGYIFLLTINYATHGLADSRRWGWTATWSRKLAEGFYRVGSVTLLVLGISAILRLAEVIVYSL